ncbi:B12-binding domain-containing protein [uncultured Ilumatobacter sp.]|jgi:excisionase family DNA binding protein|uniref:B12-binding domain-containing protein n=1 Tax=Ilumatobacter sp. TaxID=1967498 RepID=UPI00309AA76B
MSEEPEVMLELQSAADALGVHYQTAYRWVRSGRLPAQLTGGKYLVSSVDIAEVGASRNFPQAPAVPSPARLVRQSERMQKALLTGDESEARKIARRLVDEGTTIVDLIEQVISPPLRAIGQAWHDGNLTIWVEHRASAIIERALGDLLPNPRGRRRGTVVVTALSGDLHSLPTTMAAVALREAHWHVHHLGADLPGEELIDFCATHDEVDVAVISVTDANAAVRAEEVANKIRAQGTPTLVGGPGKTLGGLIDDVQHVADSRRS